jgi:hypothetical protein
MKPDSLIGSILPQESRKGTPMRPKLLPCGCYEDACYCGQYPTREELDEMTRVLQEAVAAVEATPDDRYPTLAQRLAESMKDDRRADR